MSRNNTPSPLLVGPVNSKDVNLCMEWAIRRAAGDDVSAAYAQGVLVSIAWILGVSSWHPEEVCRMLDETGNVASLVSGIPAAPFAPRR